MHLLMIFSVSNPMFQMKMRMMRRWQKMTQSSLLLQLSTSQTKRSEVNTTLHYFSYQCHGQKKVRGQHNITNTVDSLHMDEISLHKNLRPVGPVVSQNILIPKKITGPNQGPYSLFDRSKMVYIYVWKSLVYNNNI